MEGSGSEEVADLESRQARRSSDSEWQRTEPDSDGWIQRGFGLGEQEDRRRLGETADPKWRLTRRGGGFWRA